VRTSCCAPRVDLRGEAGYAALRKRHIIAAEVLDRPAQIAHSFSQPFPGVDVVVDAATEENEAVREANRPVERRFAGSSEPDRDRSRGLRYQCGSVDPVEAAREVDDRVGEQAAKQLDLLLLPRAARAEVLSEGLVLDVVPADAHTEAQPTAGEELNVGCLSCHERGLALRKDEDPGRESDALGDPGKIGEHHERIVERVALGVRTRQWTRSVAVNGTKYVVVSKEIVEAGVFDRSPDPSDRGGISAKLVLRVRDADLHGFSVPQDQKRRSEESRKRVVEPDRIVEQVVGRNLQETIVKVLLERRCVRPERDMREYRGRVEEARETFDGPFVRSREVMLADDCKPGIGEYSRVRLIGEMLVEIGRNSIRGVRDLEPITHDPGEDALPSLVSVPG
jgi:hypothetical protein